MFAFIIVSIRPSISSVLLTSRLTADCDNNLLKAFSKLSPIATFVPDATITFSNVIGWFISFVFVWYIVSIYNNVSLL